MRALLLPILAALAVTLTAPAAETVSAFEALKLIPKEHAPNVARIIGRDGTPDPERWHILVYDPADPNGLREFVVAGSAIVAARSLSQFAEILQPADILPRDALKCDSARAGQLAHAYAAANGKTIRALNFELGREGNDPVPVWKIGCLDETGQETARLIITASKGLVLAHEGYPLDPPTPPAPKPALAEPTPIAKPTPPSRRASTPREEPRKESPEEQELREKVRKPFFER